ncbi:MAG: 4Fe-4S binding protein [Deltaproteobacteria bacterium]|nr:4Fe-4S binding protein [Deltaproteobacteria bacterium]
MQVASTPKRPPAPAPAAARSKHPSDRAGVDLCAAIPGLRAVLKWRPLQFWLMWANLVCFAVFINAGLFGSPVGSHNIMIVFVWILWWFLLIALLVPFLSRFWCTMCPLPAFGEWLQRLRLIGVWPGSGPAKHRTRSLGLSRAWPRALQNIWLQNGGFLGLAVCSALLVTRPIVSTVVLGGMIVLALGLALVYRQRAFCMYLCPVSGFLGLYSMTSTVAVRVKDRALCRGHKEKECLLGCAAGYGCPWFQYVGSMERNNYCGMCFECFKTCPHDNVTLYLRPFCSETGIKGVDEAFKAFIMVALALVYSVTLLGPWGVVKDWANASESGHWGGFALYALAVVGLCLVLFPALHLGAVALGRRLGGGPAVRLKAAFVGFAYTWVPLGLLAWIAFSVPLLMVNGAYILSALSDPMGRGADFFGTATVAWHPILPEWVPLLQAPLLLVGLFYALSKSLQVSRQLFGPPARAVPAVLPVWGLATAVTAVFMFFFAG